MSGNLTFTDGSETCESCGVIFHSSTLHLCAPLWGPPPLTEADVRRIIREELDRAKGPPRER